MSQNNNSEILLSEEEKRYVIFPIKHEPFWNMYKKAQANFWTAEELDLTKDIKDYNNLSKDEKHFLTEDSNEFQIAQFNLDADAVAMVTASHNENGWTGVKMGIKKGLTHAPEEMKELKDITLKKEFISGKGSEKEV